MTCCSAVSQEERVTRLKCVVLGDGSVGKTSLLIRTVYHKFPEIYIPTAVDQVNIDLKFEGEDIELYFWDTAGGEDYERLRPLCYPLSDVMMVCFAIDDHTSFTNINHYWYPELKHHIPEVPTILVGTKSDLRGTDRRPLVSQEEAETLAKRFNTVYCETSALQNDGVEECMNTTMMIGLTYNRMRPRDDGILQKLNCCS